LYWVVLHEQTATNAKIMVYINEKFLLKI